MTITFVKTVQL